MLNLKNTLDGYLKNVEVIGNTIQDTNNLANIRSVGDKVEGQELYKIDIASRGKNIWKAVVPKRSEFVGSLFQGAYYGAYIVGLKPNTQYTIHVNNPIVPQGQWVVLNVKSDSLIPVINVDNAGSSGNNKSYPASIMSDELGRIGISLYLHNAKSQEHWDTFYNLDIQLEEGTQATEYEPYKEQKLEILSPVQLEKVGDVADRIICKDGVWGVEKNIEKININDNNLYSIGRETENTQTIQTKNVTFSKPSPNNDTVFILSDKFKSASGNEVYSPNTDYECICVNTTGVVQIKINKNRGDNPVKAFVNMGADIYVVTPNTQFIPLPHDQQVKLRTFAGQTNVFFNTEIAGQVKAQVPKSLGAVVNTHTEQIEMLHNALKSVLAGDMYSLATILYPEDFIQNDNTEQDIMVIPE